MKIRKKWEANLCTMLLTVFSGQHFNILIDEIELSTSTVIRLARWDDIQNAEVVDWSGGVVGYPKFRPRIDGYAQGKQNKVFHLFIQTEAK